MRMFNALFPELPSPRTPLAAPACCRGARNRGELAEKHRHSIMDVADRRTSWAGEDYKATVAIALLSGQSGQVQHRLWGADRVLDFCCAGLLPFKVPAGRDQAAAVLHRGTEYGVFRCRLRAGVDNQSLAVKAREAPEHSVSSP